MKLQLKWDYFFLDNSKIELAGFIFYIFYASISIAMTLDHDIILTFEFISVLFAILRCKKRTHPLTQSSSATRGARPSSTPSSMCCLSASVLVLFWRWFSSSMFQWVWRCSGMSSRRPSPMAILMVSIMLSLLS